MPPNIIYIPRETRSREHISLKLHFLSVTVIPYSGYFTWGLNFVVFVVGKQNTKISDTKIKCTV